MSNLKIKAMRLRDLPVGEVFVSESGQEEFVHFGYGAYIHKGPYFEWRGYDFGDYAEKYMVMSLADFEAQRRGR